ncbi:PDZ domain-containing protein GIPC3-like isoform X2 [Bolinopsis microptera]|uniref:PDZ domain-containing protein GIPC3-like isoform X2 n=1 Tax=Bolinopsis microptera TaxID=2820187 RepID=UPI0030799ED3
MPWFSFRSASSRHKELLDPDTGTGTGTGTGTQRSGPPKDSPKEAAKEAKELRKKTLKKNATPEKDQDKPKELQFYTQLAHGGSTKRINTFLSLKDLYTKLAIELEIDIRKIMFCTLNTPKIDMRNLLSGLVVYNDFIFVHIQGQVREAHVKKEEKALGITITDNSMGCCFVKRIKPGSVAEKSGHIHVGDQLCKLGDVSLVGSRHYAVAAKLRDVPVGGMLDLVLIEPKQGFDSNLCPRRAPALTSTTSNDSLQDGKATVRIKSDGTVQEAVTCSWLEAAKLKVDDLLESYMGIRDLELACTLLETSDDNTTKDDFAKDINDMLGEFDFPEDFIESVWTVIEEERESGTAQN